MWGLMMWPGGPPCMHKPDGGGRVALAFGSILSSSRATVSMIGQTPQKGPRNPETVDTHRFAESVEISATVTFQNCVDLIS